MDPEKYRQRDAFDARHTTTLAGAPVVDTTRSLTVGDRGGVLLDDFHLLEKLANFDRERVPERVVHARGVTAKGTFTCSRDMSDVTAADLFGEVGRVTDLAVRFSTVIHSRHSPETLRDPRGFAVKFYSREGNFDLVGNDIPVFFVRDAIQFPDLIHAFKPNPRTEKQEWGRILDFLSFHPESLHMLTWLLDDVGIPKNYMHMPGFGVNTYVFVNGQGKRTYVKFHWIPEQPIESLCSEDEAVQVGGTDFSHATHALIEAIDAGHFPAWRLHVQLMDPKQETSLSWGDPLDATKTWPEDEFPLIEIGRMVLDKNVSNQFLENEQIAFSPGVLVPGITYSNDKLLQGRIFSYGDTQRHRIGVNYQQLPINAPRCPYVNGHIDGAMNPMIRESEINYIPSHRRATKGAVDKAHPVENVEKGVPTRVTIPFENNFQQPGERWRSFDPERQERFVTRVVKTMSEPGVTKDLKSTWMGYWMQCDRELGSRIAEKMKMSNM